jgi:hypothetical protein
MVKVVVSHLTATFAVVLSMTIGLAGTAHGLQRTVTFAVLLAGPFVLTDGKLMTPITRTGVLRSGFLAHHVLVTAAPTEVRTWARTALEEHHAHSVQVSASCISGWIGPVDIVGALLPFRPTARQYQLVIFNDMSSDEGMAEVTICARPRRPVFLKRERVARHCYELVHDVEALIGEQRLVLL